MSQLQDHILTYSGLSAEEKQQLEAQVIEHPHLLPLLEEAKALEGLLERARIFATDSPSEEALAYYVATHCVKEPGGSPALQAVFRRVEARLEKDAAYRIQYNNFQQRMELLESQSNPVAQFEQLAGYSLDAVPQEASPIQIPKQAADRHPARRSPKLMKRLATGIFACFALYGMLFVTSEATRSDIDTLAAVEASALPDNVQFRGSATDASDAHYLEALALLHDAQVSTLGLFPRFDSDQLDQSAKLLETVIDQEAADSYKSLEATYYLGKVRLAQQNLPAARMLLQKVVDGNGMQSEDAEHILNAINR